MKLIIGLGNPGPDFEDTRHNAGFIFLDDLAARLGVPFEKDKYLNSLVAKTSEYILLKPLTFMNSSGEAANAALKKFNISLDNLYVVHDDLDISLGEYKTQFGVGPKVHNGITSIEEKLNSKEFWRIRLGIDARDPYNRIPGESYVLQKFEKDELAILNRVISTISLL